MKKTYINSKYVSNVLEEIKSIDLESAQKILNIRVKANACILREDTGIHFYDNDLTIFGVLAGITSPDAPIVGAKAPNKPLIEYFNDLLALDPNGIKNLIKKRVPVSNKFIKKTTDVMVLVENDLNGNPINPKIGLLGILSGLVGIHYKSGYSYIGASFDENGNLYSFLEPPQIKNNR